MANADGASPARAFGRVRRALLPLVPRLLFLRLPGSAAEPVAPDASGISSQGSSDIVNLGCVQDWNANTRVADGSKNIQPSLKACKAQCLALSACRLGVYVTDGIRRGECWLSDARLALPNQCGAPCLAFEKIETSRESGPRQIGWPEAVALGFPRLGADCDWNANANVAPGDLNFQPSQEACQAHCESIPACVAGVFVTGGSRRGECWLSDQMRDEPVHCLTACAPFEQHQADRQSQAGGIRGKWEPCEGGGAGLPTRRWDAAASSWVETPGEDAAAAQSLCLRLQGAKLSLGGLEDTVLRISDMLQ